MPELDGRINALVLEVLTRKQKRPFGLPRCSQTLPWLRGCYGSIVPALWTIVNALPVEAWVI